MAFESLADFIHMGGHGVYVWFSFAISIGLLILLLWKPIQAQRKLLNEINQQTIREKNRNVSEGM